MDFAMTEVVPWGGAPTYRCRASVSLRSQEFYSEFYRGGFFVVAPQPQVAVFKGGKWWAV